MLLDTGENLCWKCRWNALKPAVLTSVRVRPSHKQFRCRPQVEDDEEAPSVPASQRSCREDDISINLNPRNAYEFGQALSAACSSRNTAAGAELLASTAPERLPELLSSQLDAQTIIFIMQVLDSHLLHKDPNLVYQHLNHLHTTKRFLVSCKPLWPKPPLSPTAG